MSKLFELNLHALSNVNPQLYSRLVNHRQKREVYTFQESRSGELVPAYLMPSAPPLPLHSMVDPRREAQRLVSTASGGTGFLIFLGLGGGFAPQAALEHTCAQVLVIDFCLDSIAGLFSARDYTGLLRNERFTLFVDPSDDEIKNFILEQYRPALCDGIKTIPLRTRTERALSEFDAAAAVIEKAVENISGDYSVQAHFGIRWFSNIIRNLKTAETAPELLTEKNPIQEAAIAAAGPSLDTQIPSLIEHKSRQVFILCSDTALPVLMHHGIEPDAVVSIDCQHISYYHFMGCNLRRDIPLVLDIASPPLLSHFSPSPFFFSGGHPLALYISRYWRPLPLLDTSGGNVTYACLSLAESLGARRITLFGADFSYIRSSTYARGTYIYPFFEKKQNRLSPLEALFSAFLYRSPFLPAQTGQNYYETSPLRFYRKKLEEKAAVSPALITAADGQGAPIELPYRAAKTTASPALFSAGKAAASAIEFLEQYRSDIAALPAAREKTGYMQELTVKSRQVFTTLLPLAAALKHRSPMLNTCELIEETKYRCIQEIDLVLEREYR